MRNKILFIVAILLFPVSSDAQTLATQATAANDSDVRPTVTEADLKIVKRAREILNSPIGMEPIASTRAPMAEW